MHSQGIPQNPWAQLSHSIPLTTGILTAHAPPQQHFLLLGLQHVCQRHFACILHGHLGSQQLVASVLIAKCSQLQGILAALLSIGALTLACSCSPALTTQCAQSPWLLRLVLPQHWLWCFSSHVVVNVWLDLRYMYHWVKPPERSSEVQFHAVGPITCKTSKGPAHCFLSLGKSDRS